MKEKLTEEEKQLALSAKDAHNLIEMTSSNGWKVIKEMYFDVNIEKCKEYLEDTNNTDMFMIQAKRELLKFIQNLLDDIQLTVSIGLDHEKELVELKEKKK